MKIKAALASAPSTDFTLEEVNLDEPREDEVLVKIVGVGICHSDIAARDQHIPVSLPAVLGHEGSGIVEKVGANVTDLEPGDHVVLSYMSCGTCPKCDAGIPSYCPDLPALNFVHSRHDGSSPIAHDQKGQLTHFFGQSSFATYAIAHRVNTVKVRKDAPLEKLGPLGCGVLTGAGSIMRALKCETGSSLAIAGGGSLGLSALLGAVVQGCSTIVVIEPVAARRELALELGATHAIDPFAVEDLTSALREIVPSGLNYIFDNTSVAAVLSGLVPALASQGTLALAGVPKPDSSTFPLDIFPMVLGGLKVVGISEGEAAPEEFILAMVDLYMDGRFPFDKLLSFYSLDDINEAVKAHYQGSVVKVVLTP